ncbi:MAG: glycine cleavage system aminomethyltransferase GcvT [Verrucomicrobiota bacterium]
MPEKPSLHLSPLDSAHRKLKARMTPFAGWEMPVQYEGIIQEHHAVRKEAGLFDICHMGEFRVSGPRAESWLNTVLSNDVRQINPGESQYTLILNDRGGIIDDLLIYRITEQDYLMIVNASRREENYDWLKEQLTDNVVLEDISSQTGALALQGPLSLEILERAFPDQKQFPKNRKIMKWDIFDGAESYIARSGYTGEDGFEILVPTELVTQLWDLILDKGKTLGCVPTGLGARDTLRLEASLPLNGNDLDQKFSPFESAVGFAVSFDKPEKFIGRERLRDQKAAGIERKLIPFTMDQKGAPPRSGYSIAIKGEEVGIVTSGGVSPTLGQGIGLARIKSEIAKPGQAIDIDIRGRNVPATLQTRPLYRKSD